MYTKPEEAKRVGRNLKNQEKSKMKKTKKFDSQFFLSGLGLSSAPKKEKRELINGLLLCLVKAYLADMV